MIKQTQAGHKHKHYNDDGGAAKGSGRLYRRKRRRIIDVISIPFSIIAIIWILIQVQYHLNNRIANKRMRNKATMEDMKKAFRGELVGQRKETGGDLGGDNDIDNVDVDALRERDIQNRQQQKPGYGNNDPDKKRNRWIDLRQLPPIDNNPKWFKKYLVDPSQVQHERSDFKVEYHKQQLWWEKDADAAGDKPPIADYTKMDYVYPEPIFTPERGGSYPPLEPMKQLFEKWPQENIDSPPLPFIEKLQHFDFSDPQQMEAAIRYRDLEFPFKVTNIPELDAAREKWTDEYLSYHFDRSNSSIRGKYSARKAKELFGDMVSSNGKAQYSIDSFFAFYVSKSWNVDTMGPPPTMDTDLSFEKWAKHARYADAVGLASNEVHYYWQSGVSKEERHQSRSSWSMISNDLPSFSDPKANFFGFNPQEQKGIQCRFGERVRFCVENVTFFRQTYVLTFNSNILFLHNTAYRELQQLLTMMVDVTWLV